MAGRDVLSDDQATVAGLVRSSTTELRITVERGDHIVPSFEELWGLGSKGNDNGTAKSSRALSGIAYYREAMQDHGLGKNIPTAFTTVGGRPWVENIQYNSPIEVYNKDTIVEMVKVIDSGVATASLASPPQQGFPPRCCSSQTRRRMWRPQGATVGGRSTQPPHVALTYEARPSVYHNLFACTLLNTF